MGLNIDQFSRLKKRCDQAKANADKAQGALEQQMEKLKEVFLCDTVEEAETLLEESKSKNDEIESKYEEELKAFEEKWGTKI